AYTVVYYFGFFGLCAAAALVLCLGLYALAVKKPAVEKSVVLFVAAVIAASSVVFVISDSSFKSASERYNGETVSMTAKVKSDGEKRYGAYIYELEAEKINSDDAGFKVMLYSNYKLSCEYGDTIRVKAELSFCNSDYFRSRRFVYKAESEEYKLDYKLLKKGEKDISYFPVYLRNTFSDTVRNVIGGENGELCSVMTFGNRDALSGEIDSVFSKTGLSFLIVISGLHMSIISMFIMFVLSPLIKLKHGRKIRAVIVVVFIILYMLITGCTASVVRSGIAIILSVAALPFHRRSDKYNNLGLAAAFLIVPNPYAVGDVGMLLSFSSVLGILYFFPRLSRRFEESYYERLREYIREINRTNQRKRQLKFSLCKALMSAVLSFQKMLIVSVSAMAGSLPIVCLSIGFVNPAVLIMSVILIPLTTGIIVFTLITAFVYFVPVIGIFSYLSGAVADLFSWLMITVVRYISSVPYLTLYLDRVTVWIWIAVFAVLIGAVIIFRLDKRYYLAAFLLSLVFLVSSFGTKLIIHSSSVNVRVIGTGYPCVCITGGGVEALVSYGGEYDKIGELSSKLKSSCSDITTRIVPDDSLRTSRYAVNILNQFDVKRVMLYHSKRTAVDLELDVVSVKQYEEFYSSDTFTLDLGQGVKDTIINDGKSTWQFIESGGVSVLVVPDKADAERLDKKYANADFIVRGTDIKNVDLLGGASTEWITSSDLDEDFNIKIK
ncbi:MAG: ComEC/Rec2 family competence protein, partial [Ruminococcus sp.]|nr:ComEC/Rec2 family competence protein [Ruminococcus sp.]